MSVPMPLDVLSAAKQPVPKIADMKDMKIFEVYSLSRLGCSTLRNNQPN